MSLVTTLLSQTFLNRSKKIVLAAALFLTVGVSSSFANPNGGGNDAIQASFKREFNKAELLAVVPGRTYTKLTFKMNDVVLSAFYADNGDLLAVTRNIRSSQLPITLMMDVRHNYADYWISDLFEITADGTTNYYITLENADMKITLRSVEDSWEVYSKKTK
jgi:hypothetical protein